MSDSNTRVPVVSICKVVTATYTRPADTNAYTANDALSNATATTHAVLTFSGCGRKEGFSGTILEAWATSSANTTALRPSFELWLATAAPTAMEDNAAFDPSDAELLTMLPPLSFSTWRPGNDGAAAAGNIRSRSDERYIPFVCASGSKDLSGVVKVLNAYVPVTGEVITFSLLIRQD